jgi:hypothetical protein
VTFLPAKEAKANVVYNFTGDPIANITDPTLGTTVDASVILNIPEDYTGTVPDAQVISYTLTAVGSTPLQTITVPGSGTNFGESITLENGVVTQWSFAAEGGSPGNFQISTSDGGNSIVNLDTEFQNFDFDNTGTWVEEVQTPPAGVPEGPTLPLLASGAGGLLFVRRFVYRAG